MTTVIRGQRRSGRTKLARMLAWTGAEELNGFSHTRADVEKALASGDKSVIFDEASDTLAVTEGIQNPRLIVTVLGANWPAMALPL